MYSSSLNLRYLIPASQAGLVSRAILLCDMTKTNSLIQLAGCIILNDQEELLMLHRYQGRTQWELPGGKIEPLEHPQTAAQRELLEELGVKTHIDKELGSKEFVEDGIPMRYTWFIAHITDGHPTILEPNKFDKLAYLSWQTLEETFAELSLNARNLVLAHQNEGLKL